MKKKKDMMKNRLSFESLSGRKDKIAVVGLGYVGLPLAVHLDRYFSVVGFDIFEQRIGELKRAHDRTREVTAAALKRAAITFSSNAAVIKTCRLIIVTVPTPIDESRMPDLDHIRSATDIVGRNLSKGSCVVFESTVYPGVTEEICVPILEKKSGLKLGKGFTVGYSPERINPGDKIHTIESIVKVVSASDDKTLDILAMVYGKIVKAGIHRTPSIKTAEAAKVIENTQRDLNIALMNELSIIFNRLGIDTAEVLEAAGTKWNFLPFRPGLVGGHCIGVDPYYLTFKAEMEGYHPEMILAGRRINDGMGKYVAEKTIKLLITAGKPVRNCKVAVLGLTFKENIPDLRNTRVIDIVRELEDYGIKVVVHDPLASAQEAFEYYGVKLQPFRKLKDVHAVIVAVAHDEYHALGLKNISGLCSNGSPLIVDIKGIFNPMEAKTLGIQYWRL